MGSIIARFIPGLGLVVQPVMGATTVKVFGEVAITYFENMYPHKVYVVVLLKIIYFPRELQYQNYLLDSINFAD
jgi:hypothetical protein